MSVIDGGPLDDTLSGGPLDDTLNGLGGSDLIFGNGGNDTLLGADGNDTLEGGSGDDTLFGDNFNGTGNDILRGGSGNDRLSGGLGKDALVGGLGDDTYTIVSADATVIEQANEGNDRVNSFISFTLEANLEKLALVGTANIDGTGNDLANVVLGNLANNFLNGRGGNDSINGLDGNDTLIGGTGNDTLAGGNGSDRVFERSDVNFTLSNTQLIGNGTDRLISIENATLVGGASRNVINATGFTAGSVLLGGLDGADTLIGSSQSDFLDGGAGNDSLNGGNGNDVLDSGSGNDTLIGESGNDTLTGGSGNDSLNGGAGNDLLTGGVGSDQFVFSTGRAFQFNDLGVDQINDFSVGIDKIVLSKTTFDTLLSGAGGSLSPFEFEVVDTFSGQFSSNAKITYNVVTGSLSFNRNGSVVVGGDAEGNVIADLNPNNMPGGPPILTASDFLIVA